MGLRAKNGVMNHVGSASLLYKNEKRKKRKKENVGNVKWNKAKSLSEENGPTELQATSGPMS